MCGPNGSAPLRVANPHREDQIEAGDWHLLAGFAEDGGIHSAERDWQVCHSMRRALDRGVRNYVERCWLLASISCKFARKQPQPRAWSAAKWHIQTLSIGKSWVGTC
jgi:hypothetical protein